MPGEYMMRTPLKERHIDAIAEEVVAGRGSAEFVGICIALVPSFIDCGYCDG
jgi:hypothetical protein